MRRDGSGPVGLGDHVDMGLDRDDLRRGLQGAGWLSLPCSFSRATERFRDRSMARRVPGRHRVGVLAAAVPGFTRAAELRRRVARPLGAGRRRRRTDAAGCAQGDHGQRDRHGGRARPPPGQRGVDGGALGARSEHGVLHRRAQMALVRRVRCRTQRTTRGRGASRPCPSRGVIGGTDLYRRDRSGPGSYLLLGRPSSAAAVRRGLRWFQRPQVVAVVGSRSR